MKKWFFLIWIIIYTSMVSCAQPMDQASETPVDKSQATLAPLPITVCYTALTGTQSVTWYAYKYGIFDKYGLNVNMVYITSGTKSITALIAGDIDLVTAAGSAAVNALAADQDVVMIAGFFNQYPSSLVVHRDIHSPRDLVGKSVAISQLGSSTDAGARLALQHLGLTPDKDVTILAIGDESERLQALEADQVAGAILASPNTIIAYAMGHTEMVNLAKIGIAYQHTGVVTTRAYLASHPQESERFMKAVIETIFRMKNDPEGIKSVMAEYMLLDPIEDERALEDAYQTLILQVLESDPYPTLEGIQTLIDLGSQSNPALLDVIPESLVDISILDRLHANGFFETLK